MATIKEITISNFKGIEEVTLSFGKKGAPPVTTLIGLNESGKTTILEGLSHFITGDSAVSNLFDGIHSKSEIASLIPVNKKANFTGEISISAAIDLSDDDYKAAAAILNKHGYELEKESFPAKIVARRVFKFVDSEYKESSNIWNLKFRAKKGKSKSFQSYTRPSGDDSLDLWQLLIRNIQARLPRIAYFPTFLVDMPKKIYLAEHLGESAINKYYRVVFQDILDSLEENLDLRKHVVERINGFKDNSDNPNWFSIFWGSSHKAPIDSVFSKISSAVTKQVLGSWQKIFQRKISAKNILVEWGLIRRRVTFPMRRS